MKTLKMKKEDFKKVPFLEDSHGDIVAWAIVVIPLDNKELHESGYRHVQIVAVNCNDEPICKLHGDTDIFHIIHDGEESAIFSIDCLPCGYVRFFGNKAFVIHDDPILTICAYHGEDV